MKSRRAVGAVIFAVMCLQEFLANGRIRLTQKFLDNAIPPYAILSHTWGDESQEVTFNDMVNGFGDRKDGYEKIQFCGDQAAVNGLQSRRSCLLRTERYLAVTILVLARIWI
jgi:hypothetical protein